MVVILSNEDVGRVLTMDMCLDALEGAYIELAEGRAVNQLRYDTNMPLSDRSERLARYEFKTMTGILPGAGVAAIRLSSTLNHKPVFDGIERAERLTNLGLIQLYSTETGEPLAIMSDGLIQGMRVGATFALAIKYLARQEASVMGLLGSGWQARFQVAAAACVRSLELVKVFSPNAEHRQRFAREVGQQYGVNVVAVSTADEAVQDVDILTAATNARAPLVNAAMVRPGMHVNAVTQDELSDEAIAKAGLLAYNTEANFLRYEGGEGQYGKPVPHGPASVKFGELPLLEDVITGKVRGRTSDSQITMFSGNGLGIQFAAVGARVYERAKSAGLGHEIPTEWLLQTEHT